MFKIGTKTTMTTPEPLVRLAAATGTNATWVAGDNDMNTVYAGKFMALKALVQAGWRNPVKKPGVIAMPPNCSRVYLPTIVATVDGGAILCMKLGVKEVAASGVPFAQCDWGSYVVRFNKGGKVEWHGRYQLHKGNTHVVYDPFFPNECLLIATTGIVWKLNATTGAVLAKTNVTIGATGEKITAYAAPRLGAPGIVTIGYVGCDFSPSAIRRYGIDANPIVYANPKTYPDMNGDVQYCKLMSAWGQPKGVWVAVVHGGQLRYNFVGPRMKAPRWSPSALPSRGAAVSELRHPPALFRLPGNKKDVGVVFRRGSEVVVSKLNSSVGQAVAGVGSFPAAAQTAAGATLFYVNGNAISSASVVWED